ncbi:uncharacterized protein LOC122974803 isoform X5 [Thunnus albacares]|uniref:uncharacterized protein LOC122974803 isoform X5 n=1 Tax=Thunnus albacares TaxID=8236 RepID=UPI001CF6719B|nr:uncharacterized protein LOC122974803 isoform X5 [Thunnus albacares]
MEDELSSSVATELFVNEPASSAAKDRETRKKHTTHPPKTGCLTLNLFQKRLKDHSRKHQLHCHLHKSGANAAPNREMLSPILLCCCKQCLPARPQRSTIIVFTLLKVTIAVAQSDAPWLEAGQDRWPNRANYDALSMPRENSQHSSWPSEDQSSQSEAGHNNIMQTPQDSTRAESFLSLSDCRAPTAPNTICDFGQTVPVPWRDHRDNTQHRCTNTSSQALTVISSQQWAPFLPLSKMLRRHSSSPSDQEELCIPPRQGTDASDTTTSAPLSRLKERHGGQTALLKYCT